MRFVFSRPSRGINCSKRWDIKGIGGNLLNNFITNKSRYTAKSMCKGRESQKLKNVCNVCNAMKKIHNAL